MKMCNDALCEQVKDDMKARIALLEGAIRKHRDMMWEGYRVADKIDQQLYAVLQEQEEEVLDKNKP